MTPEQLDTAIRWINGGSLLAGIVMASIVLYMMIGDDHAE